MLIQDTCHDSLHLKRLRLENPDWLINYVITFESNLLVNLKNISIESRTSTTPSCGGPLRAQIFQKLCFYEQKYDFWPIRTHFDSFKGTPIDD